MSETTPALVAEQATLPNILPLDGVTLIGIFNAHDGPAALLRSSRGKIERVTPGAQAMGMTVTAIGADTVMLTNRAGTTHALAVPGS